MFIGKLFEKRADWASFTSSCLLKTAADSSNRFEKLVVFEKFLVSIRTLYDYFRLAVDGEDRGLAGFFQLSNVIFGTPLKIA